MSPVASASDRSAVPQLCGVWHWRAEPPFAGEQGDWLERAALAGQLAGEQLHDACATAGFVPETVVVASSILGPNFTSSSPAVERFVSAVETYSGHRPRGILNAYQCAGWGYALRHLMRHTAVRRVALLLVDVDLHQLDWMLEHPVVGRSGFGLTSLLFDLPAGAEPPECGGPFANSAYGELLIALRKRNVERGAAVPVFMPFSRPPLYATAQRVVGQEALMPNFYEQWGHCFGADPWIGLVRWLNADGAVDASAGCRVLAGAVGFAGYYTLSDVEVRSDMPRRMAPLSGARLPTLDA
ncbi:hypothetical protein QTH90_24150 [Variovorax sp. J2P1-59]|uniref:hypothetical protein n=1 Tax=Variovorax flavidus TaxID=3053501 RepID=UPI002576DADC|nr:hypothetical protein [Variovorax sp. J2P1-59]MDM0077520.1 hypothetical protein [Variovorax sp. J2P1-59]